MAANPLKANEFPSSAPAANPVFYRTYSRQKEDGSRESFSEVSERVIDGLTSLGRFNATEKLLVQEQLEQKKMLPSGRWLWIGGTPWIEAQENFSGAYNCTSTELVDWDAFGYMMDLAMMGSGTGALIEERMISQLPPIRNQLKILRVSDIGTIEPQDRDENTWSFYRGNNLILQVGDSRKGWVSAYQGFIEAATRLEIDSSRPINVLVDLGNVRPAGEKLKGFGGTSNPIKLKKMFYRIAEILNNAVGRQLNSVECCLLLDEAATVVVAGNIRRSAGMRQFGSSDLTAATAKDNLWQQEEDGEWKIDPKRDALRMANHTRVFHTKPSLEEVKKAVTKQFFSGEGAIQYAPEALARANVDLLNTEEKRKHFIDLYCNQDRGLAADYLASLERDELPMDDSELNHRMTRYGLNPCGEIIGTNFHCNLSEIHLNQIDPHDWDAQERAFRAGALTAGALLHHTFEAPRYRESRELDPIVGVSFTGLFDFFVNSLGAEWLQWFVDGRPQNTAGTVFRWEEASCLKRWRKVVEQTLEEYCLKHGLKVPNRATTVQPAGTKSLLTGASSGWHPPKSQRFIRRITFRKDDPVALACIDYGYSVVPSQSDKDEDGKLLNDPFDERCTEWLVEIPYSTAWADLPGCDDIDISKISAAAQYDFYMQVQTHYTTHNTSATIEYRQDEIEELSKLIHSSIQRDEGYISAALLARFDAGETFPRLPFEPISKERYVELIAEKSERCIETDFHAALLENDKGEIFEAGPAPCDSDICLKSAEEVEAKPWSEDSMFAPV